MDGELVGGNWHSGTAEGDGREYRGWILGHFIDPAEGVRSTKDVEIKWGVHPAGDKRVQWTTDDQRTTLVFRISGKFRIDLTEGSFTLEREGDYLVWGPRIDHAWEAITDAVVVTVRWPSSVSWETKSPGRHAYLSLGLTNVPAPDGDATPPGSPSCPRGSTSPSPPSCAAAAGCTPEPTGCVPLAFRVGPVRRSG